MEEVQTTRRPYATVVTVALTLALYAYFRFGTPDNGYGHFALYLEDFSYLRAFTYALTHSSVGHVTLNMLMLATFGMYAELRVGTFGWIVGYGTGAFVAAVGHIAMSGLLGEGNTGPLVGASGAVATIIGCAFVQSMREPSVSPWTKLIRFGAPLWLVVQIGEPFLHGSDPGGSVSAIWAHLAGFVYGLVLFGIWRVDQRSPWEKATALLAAGNPAAAIPMLDQPLQGTGDQRRLELLASAWLAMGDKDEAATVFVELVTRFGESYLSPLADLGVLARLTPDQRLDFSMQPLATPLRRALLATFLDEGFDEPHRPMALLRLADLVTDSDPAEARDLLDRVIREYPNSEAATIATARATRTE